jgi:hypothetical protein
MLVAAMILGLIGGITYFVGGGAGTIAWTADGSAPWWVISLIPIGVVGAMGAAMARTKPILAGVIMLLAAAGALGIGFASFADYADRQSIAGGLPSAYLSILLPTHAFAGTLLYVPFPLLTLIIGGMLALSSGKKTGADD